MKPPWKYAKLNIINIDGPSIAQKHTSEDSYNCDRFGFQDSGDIFDEDRDEELRQDLNFWCWENV